MAAIITIMIIFTTLSVTISQVKQVSFQPRFKSRHWEEEKQVNMRHYI